MIRLSAPGMNNAFESKRDGGGDEENRRILNLRLPRNRGREQDCVHGKDID